MDAKRPTLRYERQHGQNRITIGGVSHRIDETAELVRTNGQIELRLRQEGGVGWSQRNLTIRRPAMLADSVLSAMRDRPLSDVVDIESLRGVAATITKAWLTGNPKSPHLTMLVADDRIGAAELRDMREAAESGSVMDVAA